MVDLSSSLCQRLPGRVATLQFSNVLQCSPVKVGQHSALYRPTELEGGFGIGFFNFAENPPGQVVNESLKTHVPDV